MKRHLLLLAALITIAAFTSPAPAQRAMPYRPVEAPGMHPPGWDWRRIYPYSPYNYGRNPYYGPWNAPPPYGMPYPMPYPVPVPSYSTNPYYYGQQAPTLAPDTNQHVMVPHPTGEIRTPPRDAAVIQVRVPDRFATLTFNGGQTESVGYTRYFVTPSLGNDKSYHYVVTAKWTQDGQPMTAERQVDVVAGKTSHLDFTKPAAP